MCRLRGDEWILVQRVDIKFASIIQSFSVKSYTDYTTPSYIKQLLLDSKIDIQHSALSSTRPNL